MGMAFVSFVILSRQSYKNIFLGLESWLSTCCQLWQPEFHPQDSNGGKERTNSHVVFWPPHTHFGMCVEQTWNKQKLNNFYYIWLCVHMQEDSLWKLVLYHVGPGDLNSGHQAWQRVLSYLAVLQALWLGAPTSTGAYLHSYLWPGFRKASHSLWAFPISSTLCSFELCSWPGSFQVWSPTLEMPRFCSRAGPMATERLRNTVLLFQHHFSNRFYLLFIFRLQEFM